MATVVYPLSGSASPDVPDLGRVSGRSPHIQPGVYPLGQKDSGSQTSSVDSGEKHYRLITDDEWVQFCRGIGVFRDDESEEVVRPTNTWWPPRGFRDGLYQDVLAEKTKYKYMYHTLTTIHWLLMVIQLSINAVLTALGSVEIDDKTVITILAAINTCMSGLLALMHNNGLPHRYRQNRDMFTKLEEHLKSIVDSRLVSTDDDIGEALAGCYKRFREARQTVADNFPSSYTVAGGNSSNINDSSAAPKRRHRGQRK